MAIKKLGDIERRQAEFLEGAKADLVPAKQEIPKKKSKKKLADKTGTQLKNYRLSPIDIKRLEEITEKANSITNFSVSETKIIKALAFIGSKMSPEKIVKAYRDAL